MRIIVVVPYSIETSGTVAFATPLCASLRAKSMDVTLAYCQSTPLTQTTSSTAPHNPGSRPTDQDNSNEQALFNSADELLNWVESQSPDCDIIFWAGIFQSPSCRARQINLSAQVRKESDTKVVFMWERTGNDNVVPEVGLFEKLLRESTDSIAALNETQHQFLIENGATPDQVELFSPGIDTQNRFVALEPAQKTLARQQMGWPDKPIVLALSRFVQRKRIDFIIRTWKQSPFLKDQARLVVMGSGFGASDSNESEIISLAKDESSIDVVLYQKGMKQTEFYNAADLFVTASEQEGAPAAMLEAMACGLPVISSDIAGHRTVVKNGENGFLFPLNDSATFSSAIEELVTNSQLRRRLSAQARTDMVAQRDIGIVADKLLKITGLKPAQMST